MSLQIGPVLPPDFPDQNHSDSVTDDTIGPPLASQEQYNKDSVLIGPPLPPDLLKYDKNSDNWKSEIIGPVLPPNLIGPSTANQDSDDDNDFSIGPLLPSNFDRNSGPPATAVIGPALPPDLVGARPAVGPALPPDHVITPGPALPPDFNQSGSDSDDDVIIGPSPSALNDGTSSQSVCDEFERRVMKMKAKLEGADEAETKLERETWMTELPSLELQKHLGLGARQFRTKDPPKITDSDRESWTQVGEASSTPGRGQKRPAEKNTGELSLFPEEIIKDRRISEQVKKYNESMRADSLVDMHSKKLRKEEKKTRKDEKPERVPFDRERDMNTNQFDDAQRRNILKKASKLDSRFSHGAKNYL